MEDFIHLLRLNAKSLVTVAAVIAAGVLLYMVARRGLKLLRKHGVAEPAVRVLIRSLRWTVFCLVLVIVLQELDVLHDVWAAILTIMAMIAVGFIAVWSILSNAFSAFLILVYRPFRIGDSIDIPSDTLKGAVEDINLMFTTLKAEDGHLIQVPNNLFFQKPIRRKPGKEEADQSSQLAKKSG